MRGGGWLFVILAAQAAESAPAEGCSHRPNLAGQGPPRLVSPRPDAEAVPTDVVVTAQWIDCCPESSIETPMIDRLTLRVEGASERVPATATVSAWGLIYHVVTRTTRLVPTVPLEPMTAYEVIAEMPSNWGSPFQIIGRFSTGSGPSSGAAPAMPRVTARFEDTRRCDGSGLQCCWDTDHLVRIVEFEGLDDAMLYTLWRDDEMTLLAMDLVAPARGFIMCDDIVGIRRIEEPGWVPWSISESGPITVHVTGRDMAGRESEAFTFTLDTGCPPPPEGGCGCRVGRARAGAHAVTLSLSLLILAMRRNSRRGRLSAR